MESHASSKWDSILRLIPGYDPFATAGDCHFDEDAADNAIAFFHECLTHIEGKMAGEPFKLELWQQAIIANLFGWKRPDDSRRYREAFIFVPRKNGKTPLCAGIADYVLFCDGEKGAQNYCVAAEREQAALLFRHAKGMIENEPELSSRCKIYGGIGQRSITIEEIGSFFKVLSADADTKHGGNSHLVIIDELHAQPNRDLVDVLQTSMASKNRRQPLMIHITTSDFERESICNEKHKYASAVRDNGGDPAKPGYDPYFLPVIYEASIKDDWENPETWKKANPNYGISVSEEYMARECKRAKETPNYQNTFKRLHLNIRTEQDVLWLPMDKWRACPKLEKDLTGMTCYGALDLASTIDIAAFALFFPDELACKLWFWIPRENALQRERRDRVPYLTWEKQDLIELTDGNEIDFSFIRKRVGQCLSDYDVRSIMYDPWNAADLSQQIRNDGFEQMIKFPQTINNFTGPAKRLEAMVVDQALRHGDNPILNWMASNTTIKTDANQNIRPVKPEGKEARKIDGIVALIMAIGGWIGDETQAYDGKIFTVGG